MSAIRQHEFANGACVHCGIPEPGTNCECRQRDVPVSGLAPAPQRRELACEDGDVIAARIVELRAEREAAINRVEP